MSLIGNTMAADMGSGGSPGAEHGSCRGAQEPDMSPSLRAADHSQLPTQLNDQPQPDDADSHQVCKPSPGHWQHAVVHCKQCKGYLLVSDIACGFHYHYHTGGPQLMTLTM